MVSVVGWSGDPSYSTISRRGNHLTQSFNLHPNEAIKTLGLDNKKDHKGRFEIAGDP